MTANNSILHSEVYVGMRQKSTVLPVLDGVMNVLLGILLLLFPAGVLDLLGLPQTSTYFYPSILGAVLVGIGVALFIEVGGSRRAVTGLGVAGAIAINICGGRDDNYYAQLETELKDTSRVRFPYG